MIPRFPEPLVHGIPILELNPPNVFENTELEKPHSDARIVYAVLENEYGGLTFHGVFGLFWKAKKRAAEHPGADIYRCDLDGNWRQLESYVKVFTIKESLEDPNYNRQTGGSRMQPAKVLERIEGIENARQWIKAYVARTFKGQHDRVSWPKNENHDGRVRADIHTSRVQNPGTEREHLLGGFYIGSVVTEPVLWEYVDCENVTSTSS